MRYKVAYYFDIIGVVLSVLFLGGFSLAVKDISEKVFVEKLYPTMALVNKISPDEAYKSVLKMSLIWGGTAFIVLILGVIASFFLKNKRRIGSIPFNLLSCIILLIGTNFVAFPLAFFFFIATLIALTLTPEMKKYEEEKKIIKMRDKNSQERD